jgi:hypothetical protein
LAFRAPYFNFSSWTLIAASVIWELHSDVNRAKSYASFTTPGVNEVTSLTVESVADFWLADRIVDEVHFSDPSRSQQNMYMQITRLRMQS